MNILKNRKKKKGFTLIELIVVIAIIAVLALIIIPRIVGYTSQASTAQVQADARTMSEVIDVHNANTNDIPDTAVVSSLKTSSDASVSDAATKVAKDTTVSNATVGNLDTIAENGK